MKKIALIAALGLMGATSAFAQASPINSNFDVTVTLTSRCQLTAPVNTTLAFGTYVAFVGPATSNSVAYTLTCTRGFGAPTVSFDVLGAGGADGAADGSGVVGGLRYTIASTVGAVTPGNAATAAPSFNGTPDSRTISLQGTMAAGQVGAATAASTNFTQARQLTIAY